MKKFALALTILFVPSIVLANPEILTATSTSAVSIGDLIGTLGDVWSAFTNGGVLAGIGAALAALGAVLNIGPLKRFLERSPVDWLRPLLMLVVVGGTALTGSLIAGVDLFPSIIAAVTAGAGSGFVQKFIQDLND